MKMKLTACCLICLCSSVYASGGYYDSVIPWAYSDWWNYPTAYARDYVPYFTLHPPVYYSYHIIARPYGDSPYPYLPGLSSYQASTLPSQPQTVKNEYIEEGTSSAAQEYQAHTPLRVRNPFVEQSDNPEMSKGVKWEARKTTRPLVVYPTSLVR